MPALEETMSAVFACAERGDWTGFRAHFSADAVIRQNVVGRDVPIDEAVPGLARLTADGTTLRYDNPRRVVGTDSATEIHDVVFTRPDGHEIRLDICVVMWFNDQGQITRADEYLDSQAAAALFA